MEHAAYQASSRLAVAPAALPLAVRDKALSQRIELADVLAVCSTTKSLSEAGRRLFAESRKRCSTQNDADRLRKYLARCGVRWADFNA